MRTLLALLVLPLTVFAQVEAPPAPAGPPPPPAPVETPLPADTVPPVPVVTTPPWKQPQPVHEAVPVPRNWNVGAGVSFQLGTIGFSSPLAGLAGGSALSLPENLALPRATVLLERRLSDRLFLTFNAGVAYSGSNSQTFSALSNRVFSVEGTGGLRGVLNPGGVIEVSLFGNVGVAYTNYEHRTLISSLDSTGMVVQVGQQRRGNAFTVGATAGLALERELIAGLALRLSSGILGGSYSGAMVTTTVADSTTENETRGGDVGLRFSPAIELRYAF